MSRSQFYLFGYPIAHSASPAFHNEIFRRLGLTEHYYQTHDTVHPANLNTDVKSDMLVLLRSPTFGGCSVTMPIKVVILDYVDRLGDAAREIGSANTIYLEQEGDKLITVGENFDWVGVRNALLLSLPAEQQATEYPLGEGKCGYIIGGGGTCRAAVYALSQLKLSPVYLVNRDDDETQAIIKSFPQYDLRPIRSPSEWTPEIQQTVAAGVGSIPCIPPSTEAEENVYAIADKIFTSPSPTTSRRPFLEMCYKPRKTTMFNMATDAGWNAITGIEAMIEQGLAQSRAWLLTSAASPYGGKRKELGEEAEAAARALVREMDDIVVRVLGEEKESEAEAAAAPRVAAPSTNGH